MKSNRFAKSIVFLVLQLVCSTRFEAQEKLIYPSQYDSVKGSGQFQYIIHTPLEFIQIIKTSKIVYSYDQDSNLSPYILNPQCISEQPLSPHLRAYIGPESSYLDFDLPTDEIIEIMILAEQAYAAGDYEKALSLYSDAVNRDSAYYKSWTLLGNTYFTLGRYTEAEAALLRAVALNDDGYQECFFLGDTYFRMNRKEEGLKFLTRAFMLNGHNSTLLTVLENVLASLGMRIRENRLQFPFSMTRAGVNRLNIYFSDVDAYTTYITLVNCLAVWEMEEQFSCKFVDSKSRIILKQIKYEECLINFTEAAGLVKEFGLSLNRRDSLLIEAINSDYLTALVYWEIIACEEPAIILLLSDSLQERIIDYINNYVYEAIPPEE
jgi:tetratricopeptide (TPR) repeat protein